MRVLVTAGPTREAIDPVRYVSNRSSGKMGYAVARAARRRGHDVVLVSGPVALASPGAVNVVRVTTAEQMREAVEGEFPRCDALVMAAAVADWRPKAASATKLKKADGPPAVEMVRTPDILAAVAAIKGSRIVVGFAAETGAGLLPEAQRKLLQKRLDLVVANDVSAPGAGFEVDTNRVAFVSEARIEELPLMSKDEVAERLVEWIEARAGGACRADGASEARTRLRCGVGFLQEVDKLKRILRRSYHLEGGRAENDAEHSWHLATMAMILAEHAREAVDMAKVLRMILVHDVVEVDAGDTYCYDEAANEGRHERETVAARRLFGLLPDDQGRELLALWEEFEARKTPEARYAAALDRFQPLLLNYCTEGRSWREHGITKGRVIAANRHMEEGAPAVWAYALELIDDAVRRGWLADEAPPTV